MQPLGIEQVDLLDVLLERGVAGSVPIDIVGRAQAFAAVQHDIGGLGLGSAMCGERGSLPRFEHRFRRVRQRVVIARLGGEPQFGKRLDLHQAHNEDGTKAHARERQHVEDATEPFPSLTLRVVENWFVHGWVLMCSLRSL